MERDDIKTKLETIFQKVMNDPEMEINDAMTADDHDAWDSLNHINLIIETENAFSIKIKNAEVARLSNVGDLISLILKKKQA